MSDLATPSTFSIDKEVTMTQTETCIMCGTDTGVNINESVDFRLYYVEGAGQLCVKCFAEVYSNDKRIA